MGWGSSIALGCGVGWRRGSDPVLLWPWCRPVATAPIGLLAWEPLYATGVALKRLKKNVVGEGDGCLITALKNTDITHTSAYMCYLDSALLHLSRLSFTR